MTEKRLTIERTYDISAAGFWDLWTTKEGIESWWGPEGFSVSVRELDVRVGGELRYTSTATGAEQIAVLKRGNLPLTTEARITYTDIKRLRLLAFETHVDFIAGVEPYGVTTTVEVTKERSGIIMNMAFGAMHDETWTQRAIAGHRSQILKLTRVINERM